MGKEERYLKICHAIANDNVDELRGLFIIPQETIKSPVYGWISTTSLCEKYPMKKCWEYLAKRAGSSASMMARYAIKKNCLRGLYAVLKHQKTISLHLDLLSYIWSENEHKNIRMLSWIHRLTPRQIPISVRPEIHVHDLRDYSYELEWSKSRARKRACMVMLCTDKTLINLDLLPLISQAIMTFW